MDFFAHQEQARRHTSLLIIYFVLGLLGLIAAIYLTAFFLFQFAGQFGSNWPCRGQTSFH